MRNLIDIKDFSKEEIDELIKVAKDIISNKEKFNKSLEEQMCMNL